MENKGIILIATTHEDYFKMSLLCYKYLKEKGQYNENITIITNLNIKDEIFKNKKISILKINLENFQYNSRLIKTKLNEFSPYRNSLYLDSDMLTIKPFQEIWQFLNKNDICLCEDDDPTPFQKNIPYFNSGLILWKKSKLSDQFFNDWNKKWEIYKKTDQEPLYHSLIENNIKPFILPSK